MTDKRFVATSAASRALDLALETELGLRAGELMEIAGAGCFLLLRSRAQAARRLVVVSGPGQNGGDGFVVARYAAAAGHRVSVFATKAPAAGASRVHLDRLQHFDASVSFGELAALERELTDRDALVVDALFGTGVSHPVRPDAAAWIAAVNRTQAPIVSVDVPSGLDADTGEAPSGCVRAAATLTIGTFKPGLLTAAGARCAGVVELVPLPYPPHLTRALRTVGDRLF